MIYGAWEGPGMGIHSSKGLESNVGQRMTLCQWASPGGVGMSMVMCVALLTTISYHPPPSLRSASSSVHFYLADAP